jgi:hypothetical protein
MRAEMILEENEAIWAAGRFPLICTSFTCRELPVASTLRRTSSSAEPAPEPEVGDGDEAAAEKSTPAEES